MDFGGSRYSFVRTSFLCVLLELLFFVFRSVLDSRHLTFYQWLPRASKYALACTSTSKYHVEGC